MEDYSVITKVLDKYFDFCNEPGEEYSLAHMTRFVPKEMLDTSKPEDQEGYSFWRPLKSAVTEKEISNLELLLRHKLPASYKYFLQQRYFIEIHFDDIDFFSNLPGMLVSRVKEKIDKNYPALPGRNYLPFASFRDYGVLAFDANKKVIDNDYEIVLFNRIDGYTATTPYADNFHSLFHKIDARLDESIKQITNYRDNS